MKSNGEIVQWGGTNAPVPSGLSDAVVLSSGYQHFLALRNNGTVVAWGLSNSPANTVPTNLTGVVAISAGWNHNVALRNDGTVAVWGLAGQELGWNVTDAPANLTNIVAVSAGALHSAALRDDGTIVAWGNNASGETDVPSGLSNVVSVAAGRGYTVALRQDGTVTGWGLGLPAIPPALNGITSIAAGPSHAFAVRQGVLTPLILRQPQSQGQKAGGTAKFDVRIASRRQPSYQWQVNGENIAGATNAALTINNVQSSHQGLYRVRVSNGAGATFSDEAALVLVTAPVILWPTNAQTVWVPRSSNYVLNVSATAPGTDLRPLHYFWRHDEEPIYWALSSSNLMLNFFGPSPEGQYSVMVSNVAGTATSAPWNVRVLKPGTVAAWGRNDSGQTDRPIELDDIIGQAAGGAHSVVVRENGLVAAWGANNYGQTNVPSGLSNVIAVAAGAAHSLALKANGTVAAWGRNDLGQTNVPANLTNVAAISASGHQSLALKTDGTVIQWGQTHGSAPANLTNAMAIASGTNFHLALLGNRTVVGWGNNSSGQTNIPSGLANVVAIAAGGAHGLALRENGTVAAWGANSAGQTNVPASLTNAMAIAAGSSHSAALRNIGTVLSWGGNTHGQTNDLPMLADVKLLAAGGDHSLAVVFSPTVQYAVEASKDLLLIYNTNSADSLWVKNYYLASRPMAGGANVLGVGLPVAEIMGTNDFVTGLKGPLLDWLNANPTKHPEYMVLFLDIPSRMSDGNFASGIYGSVSFALRQHTPGIKPFVTHINMNGTNDCKGYIDKLAFIGTNYSPGKLLLSASAGGYGNTNYVLDGIRFGGPPPFEDYSNYGGVVGSVTNGLLASGVNASSIHFFDGLETRINGVPYNLEHPTSFANLAGYICWGVHSSLGGNYPINGTVEWAGNSGWWVIYTIESFNGRRVTSQGNFIKWFSPDAFGGSSYFNTPVGAITHLEEPWLILNDRAAYFGLWAQRKNFAISAWASTNPSFIHIQYVGDPLIQR